jgi:hypothetical protein
MIPKGKEEVSQVARIPRMIITGEPTVYHIVSRTALDGFVLGDAEKGRNGAVFRNMSGR